MSKDRPDIDSRRLRVRTLLLIQSAILESLKHRNIVQLVQKIKDPKNEMIYIVMEVSSTSMAVMC